MNNGAPQGAVHAGVVSGLAAQLPLALLDATSYPARCDIVRMRECLLDVLERRDRDGFTRWLDTGARAGSDPGRYLGTDR